MGPSAHSSTSFHSNIGATQARQNGADWRPRVNQPTGFIAATRMRPTYYYGRRHSYAYYPETWTDTETGVSFEKGYYDENGQRYDDVTFEENGRYKNVVCHCPYCEQDTILDLGVGDVAAHSLKCPHCGGPMEIHSELDAILRDIPENTHVYNSDESLKNAFPRKKKKRPIWLIAAIVLVLAGIGKKTKEERQENLLFPPSSQIQQITVTGKTPARSDTVFLEKQSDGSYHVVTDVIRSDKILYYDRDADSYYDETTDCWAWYNTNVEPAVWQYWVEGISSDFGDFGWMEHDTTGWYIEEAEGKWNPVPEKYDTSRLWWIEPGG